MVLLLVMVIIVLIALGLVLGSFVNALVYRLRRQDELHTLKESGKESKKGNKQTEAADTELASLSITKGRSMCTHCKHQLSTRDLIPVFSYLSLRGKCRYCGNPIADTPLAELLTPALFVVSYVFWPQELSGAGLFTFVLWLVFLTGFVALTLYDLRWFELPHRIVIPLIGLALLQVLVAAFVYGEGVGVLIGALFGALVIGGTFYALYRISKEKWIGFGDVTLGTLLGLLAGSAPKAFLLVFLASLIGTLIAVPLLVSGKASRTSHLPFGPFLILAATIVVLFGQSILDWYTSSLIIQ